MPVKNAGAYLEDCINSVIKQSENNWELIAINDHSTDDSLNILNEFALKDERINVFTNIGEGIIDTLRLAYSKSIGNLITRMDADDLMAKNKLHLLKQKLVEVGTGYVATGLVKYFSENELGNGYKKYEQWLNHLTKNQNNFTEIYKECVIPSPCWMLYKSDLEKCEAFKPNQYPEDYDLCFRFYKHNLKVAGVKEVLHYWRDYPTRTSRTDENYLDNRFLNLKLHYFLQLDYQPNKNLVLWGAGKKGKLIAKHLKKKNIAFKWITNNPKKIGQDIYGVTIEDQNNISTQSLQLIIAFVETDGIIQTLSIATLNFHFKHGKDYFLFC